MLIRYKKSYEKIAMGLLSFFPHEKDLKKLQQTIKKYEEEENWQLYLWKEEDILGIVGVVISEHTAELKHLSVSPSHRNQGLGRKMVQALREILGPDYTIKPTKDTKEFYSRCCKSEPEQPNQ